jgi:beta-galactosidase
MKDPQWTGVCWYKKTFEISSQNREKHIAILFEAAMNDATVWLNGSEIRRHTGGYLPFYLDISEAVKFDSVNTILIRLDNRDNPAFPPGKSLATLDFNYYSGIYRNAYLVIKNKLHLTDPMEIDTVQGGGIIVNTEKITGTTANLNVDISVRNQGNKNCKYKIYGLLKDPENHAVASFNSEKTILEPGKFQRVSMPIKVEDAKLWSPEKPFLYTLEITLSPGSRIVGKQVSRIGIREIEITSKNGFTINGEKLKIRGTNRHQEYPYVGNALPDNAQYRDAWKIKNAGFNFVRSSHYPQSPAFLDACDELGILVMDAIPGWQFIGDSLFREHSYQDTREMCRRDRNHPSVVLWENSLNETQMPTAFINKINETLREELPFKGVYTSGWMDTVYSVFMPARQHASPPDYWTKYAKDKPIFIGEYGDWEYYAQNAGFNQTEFKNLGPAERSSRQRRSAGEIGLLQQAYNYQESHNHNLYGPAFGDANWLMFDYNRGYAPDIESSGIMDIFRLPKFAFWFYKSQSNDEPVCFIASYNTPASAEYIRVFSNGDSVSLFRNGKFLGTQTPDKNQNTTNLAHPPFTFKRVSFEPGTLRAESFKNGQVSSSFEVCTAGKASNIKLTADISGRELSADGSDMIFVYAAITDEKGNINYDSDLPVKFVVEGDALLVGQNPVSAEAGIASILLKAGSIKGEIKVMAESEGLGKGIVEIMVGKQIK